MTKSRSTKLLSIALVCGLSGFLVGGILGAVSPGMVWSFIAASALVGVAIGFVGLNPDGQLRNARWVMGIVVSLALLLIILLIAVAYALSQSTDL